MHHPAIIPPSSGHTFLRFPFLGRQHAQTTHLSLGPQGGCLNDRKKENRIAYCRSRDFFLMGPWGQRTVAVAEERVAAMHDAPVDDLHDEWQRVLPQHRVVAAAPAVRPVSALPVLQRRTVGVGGAARERQTRRLPSNTCARTRPPPERHDQLCPVRVDVWDRWQWPCGLGIPSTCFVRMRGTEDGCPPKAAAAGPLAHSLGFRV
jgi:hypothetical protein